MARVYVGLGSNIEPEKNLCAGLLTLKNTFSHLNVATIYETPAEGFEGPVFLNTVAGFETNLPLSVLRQVLKQIENTHGRDRQSKKFSSRTLDIDLLLYDERVSVADKLPHDDILRYAFVLFPLAEIAPTLKHPVLNIPFQTLTQTSSLNTDKMRAIRLNCIELALTV